MSRFGLRSNSDGFKLSEEKANTKKLCRSAKVALKNIYQKKKKLPLLNNQIESNESSLELEKSESAEEDNIPMSIVCSLPLNRISGILEKLNAKNCSSYTSFQLSSYDDKGEEVCDKEEDDDEPSKEQAAIDQNLATSTIKILCLYCDKKFTSMKMQLKHVEKFHTQQRDRRCSGRNLQTCQESSPTVTAVVPLTSQHYPGCIFCKKAHPPTATSVKDLKRLFLHLTEYHADKYFGCKICVLRFQNIGKLSKHMQSVHKNNMFPVEEQCKSKDDTDSQSDKVSSSNGSKMGKVRLPKSQKISSSVTSAPVVSQPMTNTTTIGSEEPILSRLGLTQNRLPNNRKGVRLRRESILPESLLKTDAISIAKPRSKSTKVSTLSTGECEVVFRVPTRTEILSCVFDDNFYKEVISNVRNNLLYHLDGKIMGSESSVSVYANNIKQSQPHIRSTLVNSPIVLSNQDDSMSEIHAATSLTATTAFPTLLTADQYGGDVISTKIRRPHTKHSWKWKWDSVKKFKLINEGGKIVKKIKQPYLGLRDLSKLDMWTQLTMRQKHELQQQQQLDTIWQQALVSNETIREEKQRLNEQLNFILDMRLLPRIILEQSEQAIIKFENEEFGIICHTDEDCTDNIVGQTFADENFLSMMHLLPSNELHPTRQRIVLSGEWARPRCYLCLCCGAKFEKLKSLEEHKMFRHSHILSTHYEVVGRELLAGNLLRHLFIPTRALSHYCNRSSLNRISANRFLSSRTELGLRCGINISAEDESSDSIQSINNSCIAHTEDFDTDTKNALDMNTTSPSHSIQSSSSSSMPKAQQKTKESPMPLPPASCTKCKRKCNGVLDLYRHMLDCSGDYIWSLAKKRKYRYYCGSKKRRPCNKYNFPDLKLRKTKLKSIKTQITVVHDTEESSSCSKTKSSPRQRPSDAESIKKMLENLPPKRVCKKIFPLLTKTKKTKKVKLMAKHKIFNTQVLRKTRSRQISQSTKLKKKSPFSGKGITKKVLKVLKHSKKVSPLMKTKNLRKSGITKTRIVAQNITELARSVEREKLHTQPKIAIASNVEEQRSSELKTIIPLKSPQNKSKDILCFVDVSPERDNNAAEVLLSTEKVYSSLEAADKGVSVSFPLNPLNEQESHLSFQSAANNSSNLNVESVSPSKSAFAQLESLGSQKKRSKKINDCIAMLTGKLEEKLKTEKTGSGANEPFTEAGDKVISQNEKRTPKRKTISRRIIKPDVINAKIPAIQAKEVPVITPLSTTTVGAATVKDTQATSSDIKKPVASFVLKPHVPVRNTLSKAEPVPVGPVLFAPTNVTNIVGSVFAPSISESPRATARVTPILITPVNNSLAVSTTSNMLTTGSVLAPSVAPSSVTLSSVPQPVAVPVPVPVVLTATKEHVLVPLAEPNAPLPPVSVSLNMLPKVPLYLPVDKFKAAITPTFAPLPLPVPVSVQVPVEPTLRPQIPPTVRFLAPSVILEKKISSEANFNVVPEPLNLSHIKGISSKPPVSQDVTTITHRIGPVRRQTICGFEAPNFLAFDEMEPLDLSKKSKIECLTLPNATSGVLYSFPPHVNDSIAALPKPISLSTDAALNKQFYSNLDLLKIPQVRNPSYISPTSETTVQNLPRCSSKKRSNSKNNAEMGTKPINLGTTGKIGKEAPSTRKENCSKNKPVQKMDEIVINHIDDAINSVINAVKESLPDTDNEEVTSTKEKYKCTDEPIKISDNSFQSNDDTTKEKEFLVKSAIPQKRFVRSKTLDCRPAALKMYECSNVLESRNVLPAPPLTQTNSSEVIVTNHKLTEDLGTREIEIFNKDISCVVSVEQEEKVESGEQSAACTESSRTEENSKLISPNPAVAECTMVTSKTIESEQACLKSSLALVGHENSANLISEEPISNINNTSSGFYSSGQSENIVDSKKKQRRRRKNELAAIVADQLLESFKIDKARRDNLKKLENLAYEKSEDLLLTGMLLMSSTKRNASSNVTAAPGAAADDKNAVKGAEAAKQKSKQDQSKYMKTRGKSQELVEKDSKSKSNIIAENTLAEVYENEGKHLNVRRSKRRQNRRRGKALDNENISKLKSSLESFSIGIERQISEMEAKNANMYNATDDGQSLTTAAAASTRSSILRPSILSAKLEQPNSNNTKTRNSENKSIVSSRDPRLNKNIHKDEKEMDDSTVPTKYRLRSATENSMKEICDLEEDNYLTEIAKNVNEKIMSAENEDFAFADGFEMTNELQDDSNSKFYRPPTSMSVRSAPNFNDDHSNFDSICDENTNTEVMDMDLDDELSVYTSYSQDVGRGRGRRRRRRRSILLKRRPKKRLSRDLSEGKFDCMLCKKTFFTANSLAKHSMTLAHVSKVSEQEYLQSKSNSATANVHKKSPQVFGLQLDEPKKSYAESVGMLPLTKNNVMKASASNCLDISNIGGIVETQSKIGDENKTKHAFETTSRLTLNPDERLFFECCNILKGVETPRINSINNEECHAEATYVYGYADKTTIPCLTGTALKGSCAEIDLHRNSMVTERSKTFPAAQALPQCMSRDLSRMPLNASNISHAKGVANEQNLMSPNYTAVSQFSAVTNTTSRFKTKAAMKGYDAIAVTIQPQEPEIKSKSVCKLTELAEIALGTEKPNSSEFTAMSADAPVEVINPKALNLPQCTNLSPVVVNQDDCNLNLNRERQKNNETQSSTSSKTIMHSSIIKAAVEEHVKVPSSKIVIPDRPFKNIGLEEKESITFQKPKVPPNLLTEDNSVSTASYSDRDDFDFGSLSCDDEASVKTSNEKIVRNDSSDSSSSRATAKTFENKSLIMGRIFKNVSTKTKSAVRVKSVGVQKDQPQTAKANLDQLFDELRGDAMTKARKMDLATRKLVSVSTQEDMKDKQTSTSPMPAAVQKNRTDTRRKSTTTGKKSQGDISRLQSELGMSPEEIEKLIVEGQRKSKRRCATNRPKKLVEIWSSDEYEEFLSTKDIIALIEEKEKKEQKRKRKSSTNQLMPAEHKDADVSSSHTSANKSKRGLRSTGSVERKEKGAKTPKDVAKSAKAADPNMVSTEKWPKNAFSANTSDSKEKVATAKKIALQTDDHSIASRFRANIGRGNDTNRANSKRNTVGSVATNPKKDVCPPLETVTSDKKIKNGLLDNNASKVSRCKEYLEMSIGAKDTKKQLSKEVKKEFRLPDVKQNNNYRVRSKEKKEIDMCRKDVNNLDKETSAVEATAKKRNPSGNNKNYKCKRKYQSSQSPARQKRLASEKLYYWSSSSDDEFGRINESDGPAQDFENTGEQYQKHGWIVGDSHKKLVTLLAITKGNKKIDSCGVKRNVSKKKS